MRGRVIRRKIGIAAAAVSLAASASSAGATVTIGQTAPSTTACTSGYDRLQPSVTSGNSYVVPATGGVTSWTMTSWSTDAKAGPGQLLAVKVYRLLGVPGYIVVPASTWMVVAQDGPHALAGGTVNTFPTSVPVRTGDVLGSSTPADAGSPACNFVVDDSFLFNEGNLPVGGSADFTHAKVGPDGGRRLNVSAVLDPSNSFTLGALRRNKKKGTATLTATVPNPGALTVWGKPVRIVATTVSAAGDVQLGIKAKGKKKKKLKRKGRVKLSVAVTYTPTGGSAHTESTKVQLKKKGKKR